MLEPICADLVTAARNPIVETASAEYASPVQRYSTPTSSSRFARAANASGSSRIPTMAPSFIVGSSQDFPAAGSPFAGLDNRGYCLSMSIAITDDHRVLAQ